MLNRSALTRIIAAAAILTGTFVTRNAASADAYQIDPHHASFIFKIKHMGLSYVYGTFNDVAGNFTTDDKPSFNIIVKTASVDTHIAKRDEHLRSPDFFNANQFPVTTFKSTAVTATGDDLAVTGDLALHGVTRSITFTVHKVGEGKDPWGGYRTGYSTEFQIKRSDFGMTNMLEMISDEVVLMISFEGIRE
jgi:polyisoprenoid-binding protein YceI